MGLYIKRLRAQSVMYRTLLDLGARNQGEAEYYDWASSRCLVAAEVERPLAFGVSTEGLRTVFGVKRVDPTTNTPLRFSEVFIGERSAGAFAPRPVAEHGFSMDHMMFTLGRISIQAEADMSYSLSGRDWPSVP